MQHKMKLLEKPFNDILDGSKTIEFRLYDDKRKKLRIGDTIEFFKLPDLVEKITVEVIDLYQFATFKELFFYLDYRGEELGKMVRGMHNIYTEKEEKENGVLGIKIKII